MNGIATITAKPHFYASDNLILDAKGMDINSVSMNGKPISLWCDHIDGDASNDSPDNFQMVCPNCDSQQDTFGAKNRGNGRKSRGLPQYG